MPWEWFSGWFEGHIWKPQSWQDEGWETKKWKRDTSWDWNTDWQNNRGWEESDHEDEGTPDFEKFGLLKPPRRLLLMVQQQHPRVPRREGKYQGM